MSRYYIVITYHESLSPSIVEIMNFLNDNNVVIDDAPDQDST